MNKPKLWKWLIGSAAVSTVTMTLLSGMSLVATNTLIALKVIQVSLAIYTIFGLMGFMLWDIRNDVYKEHVEETKNTFVLTYMCKGKQLKSEVYPRHMYTVKVEVGSESLMECRMSFDFYDHLENNHPKAMWINARDFIKLEPKK